MDKIRIAVVEDHSGHFACVDYAKKQGYYQENQIIPEITYCGGGQEALTSVAKDKADFLIACDPLTVALGVKAGAKVTIIASDGPILRGSYILVKKDSEFKSLTDLKGKTVAISLENSASHVYCNAVSAKYNLDLKIRATGGSRDRVKFLEDGRVDAILLLADFSFRALASGKLRKIADIREEIGKIGDNVLVASNYAITTKNEAINAALKAIFKAADYLKQNPSEAIEFLMEFTGQDKQIAELCYEEVLTERSSDGFLKKDNIDGYFSALAHWGLNHDLPATENYFTEKFVPVIY